MDMATEEELIEKIAGLRENIKKLQSELETLSGKFDSACKIESIQKDSGASDAEKTVYKVTCSEADRNTTFFVSNGKDSTAVHVKSAEADQTASVRTANLNLSNGRFLTMEWPTGDTGPEKYEKKTDEGVEVQDSKEKTERKKENPTLVEGSFTMVAASVTGVSAGVTGESFSVALVENDYTLLKAASRVVNVSSAKLAVDGSATEGKTGAFLAGLFTGGIGTYAIAKSSMAARNQN